MKKIYWLMALILMLPSPLWAQIHSEERVYQSNGTQMTGYLAYDSAIEGKRPGVLVVHEFWGLNDYARKRADMLAEEGYVAFAVDMYGEGKTSDHPDTAGKFAQAVRSNLPEAKDRFLAAMEVLQDHPEAEAGSLAAIGYCFGGGIVLEMARRGVDLDGVASFHGSLSTGEPARPGDIKAKIRVYTGAADPMVPEEQVRSFKDEMEAAGADYQVFSYEGAQHSFTNPDADQAAEKFNMPVGYDAEADSESWQNLLDFLDRIFKGSVPGQG